MRSHRGENLLPAIRREATVRGLNLLGLVDAAAFDAAQPCGRRAADLGTDACGSILVLGSGGRACWDVLVAARDGAAPTARRSEHPIDRHGAEVAELVLAMLEAEDLCGRVVLPSSRRSLNFIQLGEMGGLGSISPVIHQLIHPVYGPWVSLRAAILLEGRPFGLPVPEVSAATFQPCDGCDRPCVEACPVGAYAADGRSDPHRCMSHRVDAGGCGEGCDVRRHCRIGQEHRYGPAEEAFRQRHGLYMLQAARGGLSGWLGRLRRRR